MSSVDSKIIEFFTMTIHFDMTDAVNRIRDWLSFLILLLTMDFFHETILLFFIGCQSILYNQSSFFFCYSLVYNIYKGID